MVNSDECVLFVLLLLASLQRHLGGATEHINSSAVCVLNFCLKCFEARRFLDVILAEMHKKLEQRKKKLESSGFAATSFARQGSVLHCGE